MKTPDFSKLLKRRGSSVLGLTLDGRRLEGAVPSRNNGTPAVGQTFEASLSLDPLTNDPALVGQEIRNSLDEAGIRESRCAVGIPLGWVMTSQVKLPDIPEEDVASFLEIQSEKNFPYGPDDLSIAISRTSGFATLIAIPKNHLSRLEQVLVAARLKPVSFTLPILAVEPPGADGVLTLLEAESRIDVLIAGGGGVIALRALEGLIEGEGASRQLDSESLTRELRLTLGQLSGELRDAVKTIHVYGRTPSLTEAIAATANFLGLPVEVRSVSPVERVAMDCLEGHTSRLEFLPPKVSQWQELTMRFSSRRLVWTGATAGAVIFLVLVTFLAQYIRLAILESRWSKIGPRVAELDAMQQNIRKFRPWFDNSARTLTILRRLTEAFPEDGVVAAKTLEIKELADVTCSGVADDNQALLKVLDRLREAKQIDDVKVQQVRGKTPLQFTFNFHWSEGGTHEN